MPRTRYQIVFAAVAVLAAAGAVGFVISSEAATGGGAAQEAEQTGNLDNGELAAPGEGDDAAPPPAASVETDQAGNAPSDRPLVVRLANGSLTGVTVEDPAGQGLAGDLTADGLAWQSSDPPTPHTAYTVRVSALAADQQPFDQTLNVTSGPPSAWLRATLTPNDNEVVGIGMPAVVAFNRAVAPADRASVEQRLSVTTNPPVEGDWRWITPSRVHWRPATYWQPGTEVSVGSDLQGLKVADAWGEGQKAIHFRIGPARVSTVDAATYQMTSTENGQVVKVMPASMGSSKWPTHHGIHLVLEKAKSVTMDSSTVGIPRNGPGGYYRKVAWATRLTWSGEFIHAAPWSQWAQGKRNVSHGCINVSTANAKWFYDFAQRGDIVEVVNSPKKPKLYDPGTSDWNIPWEQWKAGDTAT
ncbi:MAG TPA: Ig-like domain-containing protein [Acidimicrobiia bacterium]|nr:Ig-like domain-containing protein [Acidimicrobiia bacterium]